MLITLVWLLACVWLPVNLSWGAGAVAEVGVPAHGCAARHAGRLSSAFTPVCFGGTWTITRISIFIFKEEKELKILEIPQRPKSKELIEEEEIYHHLLIGHKRQSSTRGRMSSVAALPEACIWLLH